MEQQIAERAKEAATSIIEWLDNPEEPMEGYENFPTDEIERCMTYQRKIDADNICDLMITMLNDGMIETRDIGAVNMRIRKAMEK